MMGEELIEHARDRALIADRGNDASNTLLAPPTSMRGPKPRPHAERAQDLKPRGLGQQGAEAARADTHQYDRSATEHARDVTGAKF